MSGGLLGALFAGVSGLDSESANLSVISNNIANANTIGYKQANTEFETLVSGTSSSNSYSPGGVTAGNRQLIDQQGLLESTSSNTDIAVQGSGLFVVNTAADGSGNVLYTRAGSFTQDASGNFVNSAGYYLQAWPLDTSGQLPGSPGNPDITSSANLSSLKTVNVQSIAGTASPTTTMSISANLNAGETDYLGSGAVATMDKNDLLNTNITANTVIVPSTTGNPTPDGLTDGDSMTVSTTSNPAGYTFTYGGYVYSRSVIDPTVEGSSGNPVAAAVNLGAQGFTFTPNGNTVTVNAANSGLAVGDIVHIGNNSTAFDGLGAGSLDGDFYVSAVTANNFTITLPTTTAAPTTVALAPNSITGVTTGSTTMTITGLPTGLEAGDVVTLAGATAIDDSAGYQMLTAGQINAEHVVTSVDTVNGTYTVDIATYPSATPVAAGGGVKATGSITFAATPADGDTVDIDGVTYTFKTTPAAADDIQIATGGSASANLSATVANLQAALAGATTNPALNVATYAVSPASPASTTLNITYNTGGTVGNGFTISSGEVNGVASGNSLSGGVNLTNSGGTSTQGGASATQFVTTGGSSAATYDARLFTGNVLDASDATTPLITDPSDFTTASLSFTISVGSTTSTFTYTGSSPDAALGQFSTLNNLATAISDTSGLTARVVNNQLYIAAINGQASITFANGGTTGTNTTPPLSGIDWVNELGLSNVAATNSNRFSTLQGLANLITDNTSGLTATVNNPLGNSSLNIDVSNPVDTITFSNGSTNTGSLLAQLGILQTLGGTAYNGTITAEQTTGAIASAYDASNPAKNMAGGKITPQFSRPITVYDSLGAAHNLNVGFIKTGTNTWGVEVYAQPGSDLGSASLDGSSGALNDGLVASGTLSFNGDGTLQSVSASLAQALTINWSDNAETSNIAINWGTAGPVGTGKTDGMSQFDSAFGVNFVNQNGTAVGNLSSISISSDGTVVANFSNGQTENLYQIPLASFADPDQLTSSTGNVFAQSATSGQVNLKQAGGTDIGTIAASSLEQSNVELADQLTQMIVAQRAYEANTKVISTADTLLSDLDQIIQG